MKKTIALAVFGLVGAGQALADSATTTASCGLNGSSFGYQTVHDNSSRTYVESQHPNGLATYRFEFLFKIDAHAQTPGINFRQTIAQVLGLNPNPNQFACSANMFHDAFRIYHYRIFNGTADFITGWGQGDGCGDFSIPTSGNGGMFRLSDHDTNANGEVRICFEANVAGASSVFRLGLADETETCSVATYRTRTITVNNVRAQRFRMGGVQQNNFGAGETTTYCMDEFASYSSLLFP